MNDHSTSTEILRKIRPPLKWAGGKYRVLNHLLAALPDGQRLAEPFAGSVVLSLNTSYRRFVWNDVNVDLMDFFREVKADSESFISEARKLFTPRHNTPHSYYKHRHEFNESPSRQRKSVLFLYLNRYGYNGLCRYNASGGFNVPFGKYKRPYFPETELRQLSKLARRARLENRDFAEVMAKTKPGDVVYCDPPYVPLSSTAYFTAYDSGGFSMDDQIRLAEAARQAAARGVHVLISNHLTDFTRKAYRGASIQTFEVQRQISRDGANRRKITEVLAYFEPPDRETAA